MELFLTTHALRSDFPYIKRDFKLDDQLMLYVNHSNNCQGVHGITCTLGFEPKVYEIPMHVIAFHYQGSDYGILVTEQYIAQTFWYCASLLLIDYNCCISFKTNQQMHFRVICSKPQYLR